MIKIDYQTEIKESVEELRKTHKAQTHKKLLERAEVLLWLKTGQVSTMAEAMDLKGRSRNHGSDLWKLYKKRGIEGYLELNYRPQQSPLLDKKELIEKLSKDGFSSIKEAQAWILKTYGIKYTENGLGNYFRHQKIKLKTGRPQHPKKDESKRSDYKKNMEVN